MDMYMKTLEFLYQYRGDGKLHEIEHLYENYSYDRIRTIVKELDKEGFIELQGGKGIFVAGASLDLDYDQIFKVEEEVERKPYKARIKLKGIQHFEIKIENSKPTATDSKNYYFHAPIQKCTNR